MVHSTRLNYKEQLERLKSNRHHEVEQALDKVNKVEQTLSAHDEVREKLHGVLVELAEQSQAAVNSLDSSAIDSDLIFDVCRNPVDTNLPDLDALIITRRSRDIVKKLIRRVENLQLSYNEVNKQRIRLIGRIEDLSKPVMKSNRGLFETYTVGRNVTANEEQRCIETDGKNPRLDDYKYDSANDDSDEEPLEEQEQAMVVSPTRSGKPASPARKKKESIDASLGY